MNTQAILLAQTGGIEQLKWTEVALPPLGDEDVLIRHQAIGVNFIEIYFRTGLYPAPLPTPLGTEAAGVVEAVGSSVRHLAVGDRVAYCTGPMGSYAEARVMPAATVLKLPDSISCVQAASMMLKGLTAQYLVRQTYPLKQGDWVLLHAAAGGVGLILTQWAKHLGARVIGVVSRDEKKTWALEAGCEQVIIGQDNLAAQVKSLTGGRGVDVVYDSVGKDTFIASLDSLKPRGLMVSFGNASGAVEPFPLGLLAQKGSLYLTRPTLFGYANTREALVAMADELFDLVGKKHINVKPPQTFSFAQVGQAHELLASRNTIGALVLTPTGD